MEDIIMLLQSYCKENVSKQSKKWEEISNTIDECIVKIIQANRWQSYFKEALKFFKIKYAITEVYDIERDVKTPFGISKQRKLLFNY